MSFVAVRLDCMAIHHRNGSWHLLRGRDVETGEVLKVTGDCAVEPVGRLTAVGSHEVHPRYGPQFKASMIEQDPELTFEEMAEKIGGAGVNGIGPERSRMIVERFGRESWFVFLYRPERLIEVHGIGPTLVESVCEAMLDRSRILVMERLQRLDLPIQIADRVIEALGAKVIDRIDRNPYCLLAVGGLRFDRIDKGALKNGIPPDDPRRVTAALFTAMRGKTRSGMCGVFFDDLVREACRLTAIQNAVPRELLCEKLEDLIRNEKFREEVLQRDDNVRFPRRIVRDVEVDDCENRIAAWVARHQSRPFRAPSRARIEWEIDQVESRGHVLVTEQREAVIEILSNRVIVLTGGPGTGKTTIIRTVLDILTMRGWSLRLCAPTGMAKKRMEEATGRDASTIHAAMRPGGGAGERGPENPFSERCLIVDETSMVDVQIMSWLLGAVPLDMHVVFVGDVNQLPSIGPGEVLGKMIDSGVMPVARLKRVLRQAEGSEIVFSARSVNEAQVPDIPDLKPDLSGDVSFLEAQGDEAVQAAVMNLMVNRFQDFGIDPLGTVP